MQQRGRLGDAHAAEEHDGIGSISVLQRHRPGRRAFGVPGSEMCGQRDAAEADRIAVLHDSVSFDRRVGQEIFRERTEIIGPAGFKQVRVRGAGHNLRAGAAFHLRMAAGVVHVRVAAQEQFDVADAKAEFLHVGADLRDALGKRGVQQDVSFRRGDEPRTHAAGPDVIDVPDDVMGRLRRFQSVEHPFGRRVVLR